MSDTLNIAVFISGTGSNLASIIDKQKEHRYRVQLVVSNKHNAKGLKLAQDNDIPVYAFEWDKTDQELHHIQKVLQQYQCQLIVLAGFMKILPAPFIESWRNRIINIHPSLLPKYPGLNTHQRVLDNNDTLHGATVHFVNAELDAGTSISQVRIAVNADDDVQSLAQRLLFREHSLLPYTISLFSQSRLRLHQDRWHFDGNVLTQPIQLI